MEKILISACLLGENTRYNGVVKPVFDPILLTWKKEGRLVLFCPESAGGLKIPRPPAEIQGGVGIHVLNGDTKLLNKEGLDVTNHFISGAKKALEMAKKHHIKMAILKDGSPSCGSTYIYDGTFSGKKIPGKGVAAEYLSANGIQVYSESDIQTLIK